MENTPCTYRVSAKALIHDSFGRILLVREKDGSWEFAGGGIEHEESIKDALKREIDEETGLKVISISEAPVAFWTIKKDVSPHLKWFAFVLYEVQVSGEFRPDQTGSEAQEAGYFTLEQAKALKLSDNTDPYFRGGI